MSCEAILRITVFVSGGVTVLFTSCDENIVSIISLLAVHVENNDDQQGWSTQ